MKCVAQRPTWQTRTSSLLDTSSERDADETRPHSRSVTEQTADPGSARSHVLPIGYIYDQWLFFFLNDDINYFHQSLKKKKKSNSHYHISLLTLFIGHFYYRFNQIFMINDLYKPSY